jgi:hypothetical protein
LSNGRVPPQVQHNAFQTASLFEDYRIQLRAQISGCHQGIVVSRVVNVVDSAGLAASPTVHLCCGSGLRSNERDAPRLVRRQGRINEVKWLRVRYLVYRYFTHK